MKNNSAKTAPLISIIIPTLNCAGTIKNALSSILTQTSKDFEIIVIDGHSVDGTLDIINSLDDIHRKIKVVSEPILGIYQAMNKGIECAQGEWLYFMGGDDILFDVNVLEDVDNSIKRNQNAHIVYGNVSFLSTKEIYRGKFNILTLTTYNICHQAIFYRKSLFKMLGYYNTAYKTLADYHFNIKWFYNNNIKRTYFDRVIAVYNDRGAAYWLKDYEFIKDKQNILMGHLPMYGKILFKLRYMPLIRSYWLHKVSQVKYN